MTSTLRVTLLALVASLGSSRARADFLEDFPHLKKLAYSEPPSPVRLGFGVTPVGIMKDKNYLGFSLLQAHWLSRWIDWELAGFSFGVSNARNRYADSRSFFARTAPKFRPLENLSIGAVVGYELITFPNAKSKVHKELPSKAGVSTPEEPFSSKGLVYGGIMSLLVNTSIGTIRVSPLYLVRTYPHKKLENGWRYIFTNAELSSDAAVEELAPESLVAIELGFML